MCLPRLVFWRRISPSPRPSVRLLLPRFVRPACLRADYQSACHAMIAISTLCIALPLVPELLFPIWLHEMDNIEEVKGERGPAVQGVPLS